MTNLTYTR